jgi:DNA-binding transcriptional MerR regulator
MDHTRFTHNLMLTIDQISQITGIRKSTLRYWEKSFDDFLKPARTHSNRREYSIEDLNRIKAIQRLLEQEHLTALGVRMRLQKIFSSHGKNHGKQDRGRKAQNKAVPKSPSHSALGQDSPI